MSGSLMPLSFTPTTQLVFPSSFSRTTFSEHRCYFSPPPPQTLTKTTQCIVALFSTQIATTSTITSKKLPVSTYLMERLGFSEKEALNASAKLIFDRIQFKSKSVTYLISYENADTVITYLQDVGLDLSQVKKLVSKFPVILKSKVDKTIQPKINLLQDLGFSTPDLAHVLSTNPKLYLGSDLSPAIQALRGIMGSDDKAVVKVLKGFKYGNASNILSNLIPIVNILENEYGIPRDKIRRFMAQSPQLIIGRTERLRQVLVRTEDKWGISRDSSEFLRAIKVFSGLSDEKINSKCQVFRSYGWSDSDILSLIRRLPTSLGLSEAGIKKKLEFYMNKLGYEPAYMGSRPALFNYSLENRVVPRYRVLSILKEKGLIKADFQLYCALMINEDKFLGKFILPYEITLPELRQVYIDGGECDK